MLTERNKISRTTVYEAGGISFRSFRIYEVGGLYPERREKDEFLLPVNDCMLKV
jgi:hypothetical protein